MFHIDADYLPMRADISPPHWTTNTKEQAESWVKELERVHGCNGVAIRLQNIRIRSNMAN